MKKTKKEYIIKKPPFYFEPTGLGVALIDGLLNIGEEKIAAMARPFLRAEMERSIAQVAAGRLHSGLFMSRFLADMKTVPIYLFFV